MAAIVRLFSICMIILAWPISGFAVEGSRPRVVIVDPYYGGKETGPIIANRLKAKEFTLKFGRSLVALLDKENIVTYLTRSTDTSLTRENRVMISKSKGADIFISIRTEQESTNCICLYPAKPKTRHHARKHKTENLAKEELNQELGYIIDDLVKLNIEEDSFMLAADIAKLLKEKPMKLCSEVRQKKDYMLENAPAPAIIVNFGISNSKSPSPYLFDESQLHGIAETISKSIVNSFNTRTTTTNNVERTKGNAI